MSVNIPYNVKHLVNHKFEVFIPKIIHQTYKSISQLPEIWKDTPSKWKQFHPDWKYMFWSDDDCRTLVQDNFPWFLETYDNYEYNIQRADAIRPIILYLFGGLYVDCDIQPVKAFDDLFYINYELYLIRTPNNDVVSNCFMASKRGVNFWLRVVEEMKNRSENPSPFLFGKHWQVMYSTGPMMLDYVYNHEKNIKAYFLPRELILPSECGTCSDKPCSTQLGYTKLLEGCSWISFDTTIYNGVMCYYQYILLVIGLVFLVWNIARVGLLDRLD